MLVLDSGDAIRGIAEVATQLDFIVNGYVGTTATQLADGQLGSTEADVYLSGANATVVTSITIVNRDSAARTFTLYLKPSGGTSRAISPVSLDLGIGHSFYTDGQRMVVMDASGNVLTTATVLSHALGGSSHDADTLANLSTKVSDDDVVGLAATQELTNKTLNASVLKGTFTNSGTVTLPPFTLGGDIAGGGQVISALDRQLYNEINLIDNGSFEVGDPPTGWTEIPSGSVTFSRSSTYAKIGTYSYKMVVASGASGKRYQVVPNWEYYKGRKITIGSWLRGWSAGAAKGRIFIDDGVSPIETGRFGGETDFNWRTLTMTVDANATKLWVGIYGDYNATFYYDGFICVEGDSCPAFSPRPVGTYGGVLVAPDISGVVTAASLLTMPAFTLNGTLTLNGQVIDAESGDAQINTTGTALGLIIQNSSATHAGVIRFKHEHTTPEINKVIGVIAMNGYDGAGTPVMQEYGAFGAYYKNVNDGTEEVEFRWLGMTGGTTSNLAMTLSGGGVLDAIKYKVNGAAGANFSGVVTSITVVDGLVTAVT